MRVAIELQLLAVAVLIGLVHLLWASAAAQPQRGLKWNVGPRDEPVVLTGMAGRLERAFANFRETFPLFAAAVIVVYLSGRIGFVSAHGALIYVVARAIYMPLYAFGVPVVRSIVWLISFIGIGMVLAAMVV
ncbi:MAPEG family protein [Caulobacter sp. DWR1-3-2b1]|uniref:MAPEG family protein n=1 Tax=Caulobacter sp. DWR1-3-2b1 TaxID=2804670 RepID=UPI003CFB3205